MALFNPTSIFVVVLLLYLSSFILFAIIRIATGISIQRIGYFSLRRIAYTPKEGIRVEIRGLGLSLHRPTFAQPTWISFRLTELKVTLDPVALGNTHNISAKSEDPVGPNSIEEERPLHNSVKDGSISTTRASAGARSRTWKKLTNAKEKIKRLHRQIRWLAMVDMVALNTVIHVVEVGQIQIGRFTMAVDTRRKMVDRGRLFRHKKDPSGDQRPAEWVVSIKSILLAVDGSESVEVLDVLGLNIHGLLYKDREGLREASIAVKLGKLHIPLDDLLVFSQLMKNRSGTSPFQSRETEVQDDISFADIVEELDQPGGREETIVQTVADSKEFVASILRGIQEIQLALSFFRVSREIKSLSRVQSPLYLNVVTHEVGIDLHRLDPRTPAHRMYFSRTDVAHQALVAAISVSVTLDDNSGHANKLIYVPMATTTIKTTLPSKTVTLSEDRDAAERNANVLFANLVITSPSVDLEPKHLSQLLALTQARNQSSPTVPQNSHRLISRLLPKATIKLSVHEPVLRFVLPISNPTCKNIEDYDLLISSISSISLDIESSHSAGVELHYSLSSIFRIASHQLYYQTALAERHNLLVTEALELKVQLSANPEVYVVASGFLKTFSVHMVRQEVSLGVHRVVKQFRNSVKPEKLQTPTDTNTPSFLRRLPPWLLQFQFEGSDFGLEIAGVDSDISKNSRGVALQLESWTADYRAQKSDSIRRGSVRHRAMSNAMVSDEHIISISPPSPSHKQAQGPADGRRLALHVRGLEGFVIESADAWEPDPFISLPRFEVAFSTSSDLQGPIFHVNSVVRALYLQYSLYRHYAIGVAGFVVRGAFLRQESEDKLSPVSSQHVGQGTIKSSDRLHVRNASSASPELLTVDVKASVMQIKADMPADPSVMFQVYGLTAGRHRWSAPFLRSQLIRLHAEAPKLRRVWTRIVSMNNVRVDMRESKKKKHGRTVTDEKSVDVSTDFIRLAVPHHLTMFRIFDNFVNTLKSTQQLHHRFMTKTNEYILDKPPEGPKEVPRVSLRSKALLFELEDGPFEWKLGTIYRLGLIEQKQRLAREEAFRIKVKRLEDLNQRRGSSKYRTQSNQPHDHYKTRSSRVSEEGHRSKSTDGRSRRRSSSRGRRGRKMRYNPEGVCSLTDSAKVSAKDAWYKLQQHNARSWKRRIDSSMRFQNAAIKEIRNLFSGADEPPDEVDDGEAILGIPNRPGLMSTLISDLHLVIDKPSFPITEYSKFLHRIGKGMPFDTQYSLLIPMSISLDMGEARVTLRDYPLDLLHIPAIRPGQSPRLPSWSLRTDFVIAEEYRDSQSARHVKVDIVPYTHGPDGQSQSGFAIDVRRTVSPVKTYSDVSIDVNTSLPTTFSWGPSYQPVIQDMMMIIEGFTKPEIDPSDRVGFWDKIRLSFHSRLKVFWKGDGDVHFRLKGSRDPYNVTGYGAGFVMCWRNDVEWAIHKTDDPKKFMTVNSGEYVLAIPDYSHQARHIAELSRQDGDSASSISSLKNAAVFKKVVMKLSGNVQWLAGLVFEQNVDGGVRSFDFKPHYEIVLKNPKYIKDLKHQDYDAFRGFRSHHIHMSIAVAAPVDRDWSVSNRTPSNCYNIVHLSPRFFTHFFSWWSLFSGVMSLPVRQGALWPGLEKTSKKFGRHLATLKYNLLLSPLFIAHIYKHKDAEDYNEDVVSATGLKLRLDSFMLDLHQRREQFDTKVRGRSKQTRASGMRINQAQLDFISADVRAVSASIGGTNPDDLKRASEEILSSYQQPVPSVDMSRFTIPDHDMSWIDMDDFVELDWILPSESNPETHILPLAFAPRFTYFRQTDHPRSINEDESRSSPFGDEPSHYCVMSQDNDPRRVQMDLVKERLETIDQQIQSHTRTLGEQELRVVRDSHQESGLKEQFDLLAHQGELLKNKRDFLNAGLQRLSRQLCTEDPPSDFDRVQQGSETSSEAEQSSDSQPHPEIDGLYSSPNDEFSSDFNNRFIIHNVQAKWNNSLRNIILRYTHQVSQRRGFVYYMSRRAVKFILDIVDEQSKSKQVHSEGLNKRPSPGLSSPSSPTTEEDEDISIQDRIEQLLNDAKRYVDADDPAASEGRRRPTTSDFGEKIAAEFTAQNGYHIRLIAPQIQLQSEKNPKSVLLIAAKGMQLKVVSIMDKERVSDDVSGLVQRRFSLDMDGAQFFVTTQKKLYQYLHLYSGNKYGNAPGSAWPPWVSLEVIIDFEINPFGFARVIQKTSAALRYEKYNPLRLKYNEEVASGENGPRHGPERTESRIDHLWVEFPHVRAICDSSQYYAMYIIVLDLLMYSEPLEKVRSERLEKIMLASDFSDLRGAPEMVERLQERIRQLEEIKNHFQVHAKSLDRQGWQDRISLEKDLANCEDELFFIMKAITTSQRKNDERTTSETNGLLRWYLSASEIVWHLMRDKNEPLLEFQLRKAAYERTDNSDGSNHNAMEIEYIHGLNLLSNALYPEMIAPYFDQSRKNPGNHGDKMLKVQWFMLEAIAGIPVLDEFEVSLFPLKVQLERELGKKLFEYIFPGVGSNAFDNGGFSPLMIKHVHPLGKDEDSETEEMQSDVMTTPQSNGSVSREDLQSSQRPGSIEHRLKPTLALPDTARPASSASSKPKGLGITSANKEHPHFRFLKDNGRSRSASRPSSTHTPIRRGSAESLRMTFRKPNERSMTNISTMSGSEDKSKRFGLSRTSSKERHEKDKASDDLSQMMSRASNYMTLAHVKVNSVVLCLSYKGKGERNIEDVHDFVFRMPVLEYRNKTWSNLDLALRLKKDVIKALISHTGAIIGNKLSHHRPNKQQQSRLRELASSSTMLPSAETLANAKSESTSLLSRSPTDDLSESPRQSRISVGPLRRTDSFASSIRSSATASINLPDPRPLTMSESTSEPREESHGLIHNAFARRFTIDGHKSRSREGSADDSEEIHRKKTVLLLGRKILGSLS